MIVHAVLVAFENTDKTLQRWNRDVLPSLRVCCPDRWVVTCFDNSPGPDGRLAEAFGEGYVHAGGQNLMYGGAINLAVRRIPSDYVVYTCTEHGRMVDPRWVDDMLQPMTDDYRVAMTGCLMGSNSPKGIVEWLGGSSAWEWVREKYQFFHPDGTEDVPQHVQGGVFAARTGALWEHPYREPFMHRYSDHQVTWDLLKAGYEVRNVNSVYSVWRDRITNHTNLKYYHDNSED